MESHDKFAFALLDKFFLVKVLIRDTGKVEYGLEVLKVAENVRHEVIEQRPKFSDVVLQRRAGDQKTIGIVILL